MNSAADLYQEAIVAAARRVGDHPRLAAPAATATVDNPLCGDRVTTDVAAAGAAVGQRVRGCLLCEASAALIAELAPGVAPARFAEVEAAVGALLADGRWDAPQDRFEAFSMFAPVAGFRSRHRCVMLPFEALREALDRLPG